uniref:RxLR effector candidate protein n=1 Tax=Peronospora matthiolae TaxID=2874970 RepID=A0AAV1TSA0_9STRA
MNGLSQRGLVNGVVSKFGAEESAEQALVKKLVDVYGNHVIGQWIVTTCLAKDLSSGQERMREILVKHWVATPALRDMIASIRATDDFQDAAGQALVTKLVDVYGDNVIGSWSVRLSLAKKLTPGEERMLEILARHWVAKQDPLAMITRLRTTKNFQDTDFYLPKVAKLLQNVKPDVNEAIFAAFGSDAYFITNLYRATMKKESDLTACEAAWRYYRGTDPQALDATYVLPNLYDLSMKGVRKNLLAGDKLPFVPLNGEQVDQCYYFMQVISKNDKPESIESMLTDPYEREEKMKEVVGAITKDGKLKTFEELTTEICQKVADAERSDYEANTCRFHLMHLIILFT